jgi:hypothetical protein
MGRGVHVEVARCANQAILDKGELEVLTQLDIDIREYDKGKAEEAELPF